MLFICGSISSWCCRSAAQKIPRLGWWSRVVVVQIAKRQVGFGKSLVRLQCRLGKQKRRITWKKFQSNSPYCVSAEHPKPKVFDVWMRLLDVLDWLQGRGGAGKEETPICARLNTGARSQSPGHSVCMCDCLAADETRVIDVLRIILMLFDSRRS